jgi:hypothetical protein
LLADDPFIRNNTEAIMSIVSQAADSIATAIRPRQPPKMPIELGICCLWALAGILSSALVFALGSGDEVTQALAMAG